MSNSQKTKHGLNLYRPDQFHKYNFLFCRDNDDALEDIREYLTTTGEPLEVHNDFDTFYGCGWGAWLIDNTKDIATAEVTDSWNPGGYCNRPFPNTIVLTPKNK